MALPDEYQNTDVDWYIERRNALSNTIQALIDIYAPTGGVPLPVFPRRATIVHLLRRLKAFGESHFSFFNDRFANNALQITPKFPPARVLESILAQVAVDFEVISRAAAQRNDPSGLFAAKLADADRLAWKAFEYAVNKPNFLQTAPGAHQSDWTVLTYFQKTPDVRVIPYANVALIGIPVACLGEEREFLAIPHEIGHVAYRRRKRDKADPLNRPLFVGPTSVAPQYLNWQEEMFADVYGALVAGPIIGLDFQDLSLEYALSQFLDESDVHPVPILRPFGYIKALQGAADTPANAAVKKAESDAATALMTRWQNKIQARMNQAETEGDLDLDQENLWQRAQSESIPPVAGRGFDDVILKILGILDPGWLGDWTGDRTIFMGKLAQEATLQNTPELLAQAHLDLYQSFTSNVASLAPTSPLKELDENDVPADLWKQVFDNEHFWDLKPFADWSVANAKIEVGDIKEIDQKPTPKWIHLWLAVGWTTEGPNEPGRP